jgi:hypothetical protein
MKWKRGKSTQKNTRNDDFSAQLFDAIYKNNLNWQKVSNLYKQILHFDTVSEKNVFVTVAVCNTNYFLMSLFPQYIYSCQSIYKPVMTEVDLPEFLILYSG